MLRAFLCFIATLTFAVSCSNLDNQNDQKQLLCGDAIADSYALVRIDGAEDFEAILVKDGDVKRAVKTEKSCVSIAAEDRDYRMLVRDSGSKSRTLRLNLKEIPAGLSTYSLTEDQESRRYQTQARCPSTEVYVARELELFFKRSESEQFSYPMVNINILNAQNASVLQTTRVLGDDIPALLLDLPDGVYKLEMRNFDAFDSKPSDAGVPESCTLLVDRSSPVVQLKTELLKGFDDNADSFTVKPAAKLEFAVETDEAAEVFVCLKKRADEYVQAEVCESSEFKNVGSSYNAPDGGAWDLYAYALDKAGNKSGLKGFKLNIYQDTVVSEIHALSRTMSLMVRDNLEYEAFKNLQKLISAAKKLELKAELMDVYWQLLTHFQWAATKNSLKWEQQFDDVDMFDKDSANHSLYDDTWAISGYQSGNERAPSYIFRKGELVRYPKHYEEFQFLPDQRMVGIRWDRTLRGMVLEIFKHDAIVESRVFDRFYEDVFIDQKQNLFVLVGALNLLLVKMDNLDDQRLIPLPDAARPYPHAGMDLSTSPDSSYYYISVAANLLRVHIASGNVQVYEDPLCWIEKTIVVPNGDVYYTGYSQDELFARKSCHKAYKINWDESSPSASPVLSTDEDYDSLTVVYIAEKPFLAGFRSNHLDLMELSTLDRYTVYIDEFAGTGRLTSHPLRGDMFYLQTADTIYMMSLKERGPSNVDQPFNLTSVPLPIKSDLRKFFPTKHPGTILLTYDHKIQVRTFEPTKLDLLPKTVSGTVCKKNTNGSHSICMKSKKNIVLKSLLDGKEYNFENDFEIAEWELLPDGDAVLLSRNNEVYIWAANTERPKLLGSVALKGRVSMAWYPLAQMITLSHAIDRRFMADNSSMEEHPTTVVMTKSDGAWTISDRFFQGLPLKHTNLPVILIGRVVSNSFFYDVVNNNGVIINSRMARTFESTNDFPSMFLGFEDNTLTLKDQPYLYWLDDYNLRRFDVYTNAESAAGPVPEGYEILSFYQPESLLLADLQTRRHIRLNLRTGQLSDEEDFRFRPELKYSWPAAIKAWGEGIMVEKWNEKLELDIANIFQTPDDFVVGYERFEKNMTLHSIVRIDPKWMDMQLRKSLLYDLTRKDVERAEDSISRPIPSPPW